MLSSVLRSKRAAQVNVEIMRAFVRLRRILAENAGLAQRLDELKKKRIGFITDDDKPGHTGSSSGFIARDRPVRRNRRP